MATGKLPAKLGGTYNAATWKKIKPFKDYDLHKQLDVLDMLLKFAHKDPTEDQCENIQITCDKICAAAGMNKKNNKKDAKIVDFCDTIFDIAVGTHKIAGDISNDLAAAGKMADLGASGKGRAEEKLAVKDHFPKICDALAKCSAHKNKAVSAFCENSAFLVGPSGAKDAEFARVQAAAKKNLKLLAATAANVDKIKGKKMTRAEALKDFLALLDKYGEALYPMGGGLQEQIGYWKARAEELYKGAPGTLAKSTVYQIFTAAAMILSADATIVQKCDGALQRER